MNLWPFTGENEVLDLEMEWGGHFEKIPNGIQTWKTWQRKPSRRRSESCKLVAAFVIFHIELPSSPARSRLQETLKTLTAFPQAFLILLILPLGVDILYKLVEGLRMFSDPILCHKT